MEEEIHAPRIGELPNPRVLNRATLIAAAVAGVLLVTVVLPAEYGVDKTGVGRLLNLTEMGRLKRAAAEESAAASRAADLPPLKYLPGQTGELSVNLAPGEGREVKAAMQKGGEMQYEWTTNNLPVHYELHGEPRGGGKGVYTSYKIGVSKGEKGTFTAPFEGTQGWYWRNDTPFPVAVTVKANGTWAEFHVVPLKPKP
ncbi:MAG TPA: hypothetical protein VKA61_05980 [Sphingomicrobium sp.]|nr:hypothetical protein [Sphingomicrobium sp.]